MDINGVKFFCKINVIITAASDRTDLLHTAVIFKDSHQTGKTALYGSLVNNTGFLDTGLGAGIINIVEHDGHGTFGSYFCINQAAGQFAAYLCIRIQCFSGSLCCSLGGILRGRIHA